MAGKISKPINGVTQSYCIESGGVWSQDTNSKDPRLGTCTPIGYTEQGSFAEAGGGGGGGGGGGASTGGASTGGASTGGASTGGGSSTNGGGKGGGGGFDWGGLLGGLGSAGLGALGYALGGQDSDDGSKELERAKRIETEVAQQGKYPAEVTKYNLQIDRALAEAGPAYAVPRILNYITYIAQTIPYAGQQIALGISRAINPFDNAYGRAENIYSAPSRIGKGFNKAWGKLLQGGVNTIGNMIKPGNQSGLF